MKVLFILSQFYPIEAGTERQAFLLARYLGKSGVWVSVVTGRWSMALPRKEYLEGVRIYRNMTLGQRWNNTFIRHLSGFVYMMSLAWFLFSEGSRYDVFHVHQAFYPSFVAVLLGRLLHKPVIVKIGVGGKINDLALMESGLYLLGRWMLKTILKADKFIAISSQIRGEMEEMGIPAERIQSIPNGVELPAHVKKNYTLSDPVKLVFVGRLNPEKRCDVLIKAIEVLKDEISLQCDIYGEGPLKKSLLKQVKQKNLENVVTFKGYQENIRDLLSEYDIFVLPSEAEGMSNALLEAMACGLPCVVSDIPPNMELINIGESAPEFNSSGYFVGGNGVVFRSGDETGLANALRFLVSDDKVRQKIGRSARMYAQKKFSIDIVAREYVSVYEKIIRERKG